MKAGIASFLCVAAVAGAVRLAAGPAFGAGADATVAADGTGQYRSVQRAIDASPQTSRSTRPWTIAIKAGTYRELIYIQREKRYLHLVGAGAAQTILSYDLYAGLPGPDGRPIGTLRTPSTQIDADDFTAEDLTFENAAGPKGQALAVRVDGDRVILRRCRLLGWQDTLLANRGRHYYDRCVIAGGVDFIFGGATAFFDRCQIICRGRGYITAASTPAEQPFGFVFADCTITAEPESVRTYLGRPWRPYASVSFLRTRMSETVRPIGWHNWNQPEREKTARYAEFGSSGPGANPGARAPWARPLTEAEAQAITIPRVLGGAEGWRPEEASPASAPGSGG